MNSILDALRKKIEDLSTEEFMEFKIHAKKRCQISWYKLETASRYETADAIMEACTKTHAGQAVIEILRTINKNQMAEDLKEELNADNIVSRSSAAAVATACQDGYPAKNICQETSVGHYGDVMKIVTTGASASTASQDGNREIIGVAASRQLAKTDLQRMNRYKNIIIEVGRDTGMDPAIIAAVISRSSRAGSEYVLVKGWSASQECFGLMQIAKQWHKLRGDWNSKEHIRHGTDILTYSVGVIQDKFPDWTKEQQLKGGLAAYSAGPDSVQNESVDENTPGKDYANDVIARAQFYREHGFNL